VSGDFPVQLATPTTSRNRACPTRVGEDPREDVGVSVVEIDLMHTCRTAYCRRTSRRVAPT